MQRFKYIQNLNLTLSVCENKTAKENLWIGAQFIQQVNWGKCRMKIFTVRASPVPLVEFCQEGSIVASMVVTRNAYKILVFGISYEGNQS
jgi:hypothetical protein